MNADYQIVSCDNTREDFDPVVVDIRVGDTFLGSVRAYTLLGVGLVLVESISEQLGA